MSVKFIFTTRNISDENGLWKFTGFSSFFVRNLTLNFQNTHTSGTSFSFNATNTYIFQPEDGDAIIVPRKI